MVRRLLPDSPVDSIRRGGNGGNSRIFRAVAAGVPMALKLYPSDGRDRISHERAALLFLERHGIEGPRLIAADVEANAALLEWVDGTPECGGIVQDMLAFLRALDGVRGTAEAVMLPEAAEACLSGAELVRQVETRLQRLQRLEDAPLVHLLQRRFLPCLGALRGRLADIYAEKGLDLGGSLPRSQQTLSPSDFGGHNALRRPDGRTVFLDFEYFGWDDPVKLTADVLWHPGMRLGAGDCRVFLDGALGLFARDPAFTSRLAAQIGLYGLRWSLIVLSDFLPERWAHRTAAAGGDLDEREWFDAKHRQLDKAGILLDRAVRILHAAPEDWPSAFVNDEYMQ